MLRNVLDIALGKGGFIDKFWKVRSESVEIKSLQRGCRIALGSSFPMVDAESRRKKKAAVRWVGSQQRMSGVP